eukprot:UN24345
MKRPHTSHKHSNNKRVKANDTLDALSWIPTKLSKDHDRYTDPKWECVKWDYSLYLPNIDKFIICLTKPNITYFNIYDSSKNELTNVSCVLKDENDERIENIDFFRDVDFVSSAPKVSQLICVIKKKVYVLNYDEKNNVLNGELKTTLPENTFLYDFTFGTDNKLTGVCFVDSYLKHKTDAKIMIHPLPKQYFDCILYKNDKWVKMNEMIPQNSRNLKLSRNGKTCVWKVMNSYLVEGAEWGEFYAMKLDNAKIIKLTENAGRIEEHVISHNGGKIIYQCNYNMKTPMTTHEDLYLIHIDNLDKKQKITPGHKRIQCFGFCESSNKDLDTIWYTTADSELRTHVYSNLWDREPDGRGSQVNYTITQFDPTIVDMGDSVKILHPFESKDKYLQICFRHLDLCRKDDRLTTHGLWIFGGKEIFSKLGHPKEFDKFRCKILKYKAKDSTQCCGYLFTNSDFHKNSDNVHSVLVHVHGGPCVEWPCLRSDSCNITSGYPYKHLLNAGYIIFVPVYRGTLGFGDEFAQ